MRILLTGASGLIGSAMARQLSTTHEIVTAGRSSSADVVMDLMDHAALSELQVGPLDALVHCAGVVDEDFRQDPVAALRMAVFGADQLVKTARSSGATRLVYVSSAHCYGPFVGRVDESSAANPLSDYAIAHFATEQVFRRQVGRGVAAAALRPCAVFGDLPDPSSFRRWSLIPFGFPRTAVLDHTINISSTGEQRRNFVGSDDIAACCSRWLASEPEGWVTLNPVGAVSASVFEFARLCAGLSEELTGAPCKVRRVQPDGPTMGDDFEYTSLSSIAVGSQDLTAATARLMQTLLAAA